MLSLAGPWLCPCAEMHMLFIRALPLVSQAGCTWTHSLFVWLLIPHVREGRHGRRQCDSGENESLGAEENWVCI